MPRVTIPVGPQHPSLKEPASFAITLEGERIMGAEVKVGYNHRGIEKAAEARTFIQDVYLLERVCGICSHSHTTTFVTAVEEIGKIQVPARALFIRTLIGELERFHSHLLWLGVAGHEIGFDTLLMYSWRDREPVMDMLAALTGNRVNYGINCLGGVRRDVTAEQLKDVLRLVDRLEERTKVYIEICTTDAVLAKRLAQVGYLSKEDAVRLAAVGPTARASGVDQDIRRDDPYLVYDKIQFQVITDDHQDVYGRALVRLGELLQSCSIIRQLVASIPDGPVQAKAPRRLPAGEAVSRYEAPRGEDMHYVRCAGGDKPDRVKIRAPTLANTASVTRMMEHNNLADVPIIIAAIDPCFSCTDRSFHLTDARTGDEETISWGELRVRSIEWWRREAGVDFGASSQALHRRLADR
jgi:membrane-bound hydrogenase subunit alpha